MVSLHSRYSRPPKDVVISRSVMWTAQIKKLNRCWVSLQQLSILDVAESHNNRNIKKKVSSKIGIMSQNFQITLSSQYLKQKHVAISLELDQYWLILLPITAIRIFGADHRSELSCCRVFSLCSGLWATLGTRPTTLTMSDQR